MRLLRGYAATRRLLDGGLHAAHGLTVVGFEALFLLSRAPERAMRRVDLAEALGLTPSGVTRRLDGLERDGSCIEDARVMYAVLTDDGAAKLERASCSHVGSARALLEERYTAEELEAPAELLPA